VSQSKKQKQKGANGSWLFSFLTVPWLMVGWSERLLVGLGDHGPSIRLAPFGKFLMASLANHLGKVGITFRVLENVCHAGHCPILFL
jgi:hypothetical protein